MSSHTQATFMEFKMADTRSFTDGVANTSCRKLLETTDYFKTARSSTTQLWCSNSIGV